MRNKTLGIGCAILASLSVIAALLVNTYAAIALALLSFALFYALRRTGGDGSRRGGDLLQFASNLIDNYSGSASATKLINVSLSRSFWFYDDIKAAVSRYALQGDAERSFSKLLNSDSRALREVAAIIVQGLDNGTSMIGALKNVRKRLNLDDRYRLRSLGSTLSANSVVRLGSIIFFPAFAGISLQIAKFASMSQGTAAVKPLSLTAIFAFYIICVNIINFRYSGGDGLKMEKSALSSAIGIIVFKVGSMLSIGML